MSQQELEHGDQEVMGVVNGHSHPDAEAAAEDIAAAARQVKREEKRITVPPAGTPGYAGECCGEGPGAKAKRRLFWPVLQVVCCVLVAVLFVTALLEPGFVVYLVNVGVLACGIVAALIVDRRVRRW